MSDAGPPRARRQPQTAPGAAPDTGAARARTRTQKAPKPVLASIQATADACRMLAGGATNRTVAEHFDMDPSTVSKFRARNGAKIAELRQKLADAAAAEDGLWIASRIDRLGVLQDAVEQLFEVADRCADDALPELVRTTITALHEAAEQLGQLPSRTVVASTTVVNYRFDGVELDQL